MSRLLSPFRLALPGALIASTFLGAGNAHADQFTYSYTGASVAIPDNNTAGVNLDINVADTYGLASFQSVSISFTHTWVGDVVATLTHVPSGRTIDLFRRVGVATSTGIGDSSNTVGPYVFSNILPTGSFVRLVDAAAPIDTNTNIASGTYRPTTNTFNGNTGTTFTGETITNLNTTFDGLSSVAGVWRLNISDQASLISGTATAFSITLNSPATVVPETNTLALVGLAFPIAVGVIRRRKLVK